MNLFASLGVCLFGFFAVLLGLSGLASFSLEIVKIVLFNQTDGELKLHPIDYVYLCALFLGLSGSCCYRNKSKITDRSGCFCELCGILISLIIIILYTIFTKHEMGNIPFFCPEEFHYSSNLIRTACQVRAANLLLLWITPAFTCIIIMALTIGGMIIYCKKNEENISSV